MKLKRIAFIVNKSQLVTITLNLNVVLFNDPQVKLKAIIFPTDVHYLVIGIAIDLFDRDSRSDVSVELDNISSMNKVKSFLEFDFHKIQAFSANFFRNCFSVRE